MRLPRPIRPLARTALLLGLPVAAQAQLISPKTIPVATGDQFLVLPSERLGMAGVAIALRDTLLDPFVNPAAGARLDGTHLFGAPVFYRVADEGDGLTLPVGILHGGRSWFGAASFALQQIEAADRGFGPGGVVLDVWLPQPQTLSDRSATNLYATGSVGRRLGDGRTAIGASASYAALDAVDGVDLLYALSQRIEQDGHQADFRLGLLRDLESGASVEMLLLHNRFDMTHDVTYLDWRPGPHPGRPTVTTRAERNLDRTTTWGAHLGYRHPLSGAGWKLGGIATLNYKTHPKIPNYEIMNIPRDPGHTWAYNLGVGVGREAGPTAVGVDVVFEPMWSETWAEAAAPIAAAGGRVIQPGERTVENEFSFANALVRMGVGREAEWWGLQLGLQVRTIRYELDQYDNVTLRRRQQEESWAEWTPSWGVGVRFPELRVRYSGRLTTGTGRPGVAWTGARAADVALASTFIPAPSGPLTLQESGVLTHQVTVSLPIR